MASTAWAFKRDAAVAVPDGYYMKSLLNEDRRGPAAARLSGNSTVACSI
jgi:hypothetical protein